eukprot:g2022.t1
MSRFTGAPRHADHEEERILHEGDAIVGYHPTSPYRRRADHTGWKIRTSQRRQTWFGAYDPAQLAKGRDSAMREIDEDVAITRRTEEMFMSKYKDSRVARVIAKRGSETKERASLSNEEEDAKMTNVLFDDAEKERALEKEKDEARQRALDAERNERDEAERRGREEYNRSLQEQRRKEEEALEEVYSRAARNANGPPRLSDSFFAPDGAVTQYIATRWSRNAVGDANRRPRPLEEERILCCSSDMVCFPNSGTVFLNDEWEIIDGNEFEVADERETVIRFSILPNQNMLVVFEPNHSTKEGRGKKASWVEYSREVTHGGHVLANRYFGPWVAKRWNCIDQNEIDPSSYGSHEIVVVDETKGLTFANCGEHYPRQKWIVNDARSFTAIDGEGPTVLLKNRENCPVLKIVFGFGPARDESWIEYESADELLRQRQEEEAQRQEEEKKRRLAEKEAATRRAAAEEATARDREEADILRQKVVNDRLALEREEASKVAAAESLPSSPDKSERERKQNAFGDVFKRLSRDADELDAEDEVENGGDDDDDTDNRGTRHVLKLSRIQASEQRNGDETSSANATKATAGERADLADRLGHMNGVGAIMTPGGTIIRHGDEVVLRRTKARGFVRFVGYTMFRPGLWIGLEMRHVGDGKHDGSVEDVQYFTTNPGRGLFVRPWAVEIVGDHDTSGKHLLTSAWKLFIDPNTGNRYYYNRDPLRSSTSLDSLAR